MNTALPPRPRPIRSFIAQASKQPPELAALLCVDPVETAADKIGALAWRTFVRDRSSPKDDPTIVRHLHDLAALEPVARDSTVFSGLALAPLEADAPRARAGGLTGSAMLSAMLPKIAGDPLWQAEYEQFVRNVAFGSDEGRIGYESAMTACGRLVEAIGRTVPVDRQ